MRQSRAGCLCRRPPGLERYRCHRFVCGAAHQTGGTAGEVGASRCVAASCSESCETDTHTNTHTFYPIILI